MVLLGANVEMTTVWLAAFVFFLLIELVGPGTLISIWFCVGALAAAALAALGFGAGVQVVVFAAFSGAMIVFLKPVVARRMSKEFQPTNMDKIIGQRGVVTEDIDNRKGVGVVKADGKLWSAANAGGDEYIEAGADVTIEEIKGVKVFVKKTGKG